MYEFQENELGLVSGGLYKGETPLFCGSIGNSNVAVSASGGTNYQGTANVAGAVLVIVSGGVRDFV